LYFQKLKNKQCLQGLHMEYRMLSQEASCAQLVTSFDEAFNHRLFHMEEWVAGKYLMRLVIKFVAEIRLGEQDGLVSVIHRISATPTQRMETESLVERVLEEV